MKKILCVLVFACFVLGAAFAQRPTTPAPAPAPAAPAPAKPATPPPAAPAPAKPATPPAAPAPAKSDEAEEITSAFGLDAFQLFKGFIASDTDNDFICIIISGGYENFIAPHFTVGADFDVYILDFDGTKGLYFGLAGEGRYYPYANYDKFFLGTTLGFNLLSIDGETKPKYGGFFGLTTSLKVGYKLIISENMYIEPSLAYVLSKSSGLSQLGALFGGVGFPDVPTPKGWNGGLRIGFIF